MLGLLECARSFSIDMSPALFQELESLSAGVVKISWHFLQKWNGCIPIFPRWFKFLKCKKYTATCLDKFLKWFLEHPRISSWLDVFYMTRIFWFWLQFFIKGVFWVLPINISVVDLWNVSSVISTIIELRDSTPNTTWLLHTQWLPYLLRKLLLLSAEEQHHRSKPWN